MEDETVLPDHHGIHEAAQGEGVVSLEPDHIGRRQVELEETGNVDEVAEIQHEELAFLRCVLEISRAMFRAASEEKRTDLLMTRAVIVMV